MTTNKKRLSKQETRLSGKVLKIPEAKKTLLSPLVGKEQARGYAKSLNCPVGIAMGGSEREVPVYGSGGFNTKQNPDEAAQQALSYLELGVKAVKPRVSGTRKDEKIIEAVRYAIGDKADLMLDANEKCDQTTAIRLLEIAQRHNALFVEEPLPAHSISGYRQISAKSSCAIAAGEHLQGITEASPFLMNGICNIIQPDLAMMGGLTESLRLARCAEIMDISVAPHFLPNVFISPPTSTKAASAPLDLIESIINEYFRLHCPSF